MGFGDVIGCQRDDIIEHPKSDISREHGYRLKLPTNLDAHSDNYRYKASGDII